METKQLTVEFSRQDLQRLIIPLVVEQLLAITVGLFDSVMVSHVGEAAISAVSLVDTVNVLLGSIWRRTSPWTPWQTAFI